MGSGAARPDAFKNLERAARKGSLHGLIQRPVIKEMKIRKPAATLLLVIGVCLSACEDRKDPPTFEGQTITSLTIRHTTPKLVQDRRLSHLMSSQPGTIYSGEKIDEDIKTLFESGLVDDARFSLKPVGQSLEVIASVSTRRPLVSIWNVVGNTEFSDQVLWKQLSEPLANRISQALVYDLETDEPIIHQDEGFVREALPEVCEELERFYRSKGFAEVKVSVRSWEGESPRDLDFVFMIEENPGEE